MTPRDIGLTLAALIFLGACVWVMFFRKDQFDAYSEKHRDE